MPVGRRSCERRAIAANSTPSCYGLRTESGLDVAPVYTGADTPASPHGEGLGLPGEPPYARGIRASMYRGRPWTIRQLAGYSTPEDTNARIRLLIDSGATGISTIFDYVTNRGYDSDHPFAEGDVGQGGVAIDCVEDMLDLYDGVSLADVSISIVLSHPIAAGAVFAMFLAAAEQRGVAFEQLRGTLQNDFMMETVVLTAPNILHPTLSFRLSMDVVEFCIERCPRWHPISFTGYNYREAGANAVQEAGLVIANALATTREMVRRGHGVDDVAPILSSFFTADNDFFEEIAKYRAARRLYHRLFTERFAPRDPRSAMLRFHVQTAGSALTAQQPLNNIARAAYHALAAVLGGTQSLHVSAYDEALCVPSEAAAMTALRTQQILLHETGVARTPDPLGGSYYVEALTDEIEARIEAYLDEIESRGGLVDAVESGWVHSELMSTAYERERSITNGTRPVVGVNCFCDDVTPEVEIFRVPEALGRARERLTLVRSRRHPATVERSLEALRQGVEGDANTVPLLLDAVKAGATLGECCDVFRAVGGAWLQPLV
jgi:methylmalonyl-CoA mutase N-terminal domain/subunit